MIFRQIWLGVAVMLLLVGIGLREPPVAAVGALVLLAGAVSRLWSRLSLERVGYQRSLGVRRAFVGEEVEVGFSLANRKSLPLPWIEVRESVPETMPARDAHTSPSGAPDSVYMTRSTSLAWYERVSWKHHFLCNRRGYFSFGPVRLRSGDIFGLFPTEREIEGRDRIIVLPRLVELPALGLPTERPFGEARSGPRIFEDPSRIVGVRDYRPGDPLKRIDWKATARRQELQSRVFEPSSSLHLLVALNVSTLEFSWEGYDPIRLERGITVAGSVARWAEEQRYAVGLIANSTYPGADRPISIAPGRDPDQLTHILESLAMVTPFVIAPLENVLDEAARRLPMGATIVVVAGYLPMDLAGRLVRLRRRGHPVSLLWVDDDVPPVLAGVVVHNVSGAMRGFEREWAAGQPPTTARVARPATPDESTPVAAPAAASGTRRDEADPVTRWARPDGG